MNNYLSNNNILLNNTSKQDNILFVSLPSNRQYSNYSKKQKWAKFIYLYNNILEPHTTLKYIKQRMNYKFSNYLSVCNLILHSNLLSIEYIFAKIYEIVNKKNIMDLVCNHCEKTIEKYDLIWNNIIGLLE